MAGLTFLMKGIQLVFVVHVMVLASHIAKGHQQGRHYTAAATRPRRPTAAIATRGDSCALRAASKWP